MSTAKIVIEGAIYLELDLNLKKINKAIDENFLDKYFIQLKDSMKLPFKVDYTCIVIVDPFYSFRIGTEMSNTFIIDYRNEIKKYSNNADKESKKLISYLLKSFIDPVLFEEDVEPDFMRQYYKNNSALIEMTDIIKSLDSES